MKRIKAVVIITVIMLAGLLTATCLSIKDPQTILGNKNYKFAKLSVRDSLGQPMLVSYQDNLNLHNFINISEIPEFIKTSFVFLEDKRFFTHAGPDWKARAAALVQNVRNLRVVRGASTITEQVARIINPRSRTLWSRWLEGFEAARLERKFSKQEIFEFYLNQVPYASNRRGIAQAALMYFNRDPGTLNNLEMLSLAYLVRSPSRFTAALFKGEKSKLKFEEKLKLIAAEMRNINVITEQDFQKISQQNLALEQYNFKSDMTHFVNYIENNRDSVLTYAGTDGKLNTTIDSQIQSKVKVLLEGRIKELKQKNVNDGAVLIADHINNRILAWVNAGSFTDSQNASQIDAITALRQPGSALKPFLYALAFEKGWNDETLINDSPLMQAVGNGMHTYRNYSRVHYGEISAREALGNSLNIPAIHAISYTGVPDFHKLLFRLGFTSLDKPASFYGEGLALGNGEVSLLELVNAYTVLAKGGLKSEISFIQNQKSPKSERIISEESAHAITDILSDPNARRREFGRQGVFNFPMQTAIKTGTSTDFHDVWAIGYSRHYTVGIWMGNLDRLAMIDVSGASGPGLLLRSVFNELYKHKDYAPLLKNKKDSANRNYSAEAKDEQPQELPAIMFPTPGLQIAMDPRIPDQSEAIRFKLSTKDGNQNVEWILDGELTHPLWEIKKGKHTLQARLLDDDGSIFHVTENVNFYIK